MYNPLGDTLEEKIRIHQEELTEVQMDIEQLRKLVKKKIDVL